MQSDSQTCAAKHVAPVKTYIDAANGEARHDKKDWSDAREGLLTTIPRSLEQPWWNRESTLYARHTRVNLRSDNDCCGARFGLLNEG